MKKVLIIVDMQNDFAHPDGALYVRGGETLIEPINALLESGVHGLIFSTEDCHPETHYSFCENGGQWPKHCVENSWGAELVVNPFLTGREHARLIVSVSKGIDPQDRNDYSGFNGCSFLGSIKEVIDAESFDPTKEWTIDIVGLALDYCVKATAIDAAKLGFKTRVLLKYTKAVNINPDDGEKAIREMEAAGVEIVR